MESDFYIVSSEDEGIISSPDEKSDSDFGISPYSSENEEDIAINFYQENKHILKEKIPTQRIDFFSSSSSSKRKLKDDDNFDEIIEYNKKTKLEELEINQCDPFSFSNLKKTKQLIENENEYFDEFISPLKMVIYEILSSKNRLSFAEKFLFYHEKYFTINDELQFSLSIYLTKIDREIHIYENIKPNYDFQFLLNFKMKFSIQLELIPDCFFPVFCNSQFHIFLPNCLSLSSDVKDENSCLNTILNTKLIYAKQIITQQFIHQFLFRFIFGIRFDKMYQSIQISKKCNHFHNLDFFSMLKNKKSFCFFLGYFKK